MCLKTMTKKKVHYNAHTAAMPAVSLYTRTPEVPLDPEDCRCRTSAAAFSVGGAMMLRGGARGMLM